MAEGQTISRDEPTRGRLREMKLLLEQVESVISVAVAALEHQNCERDADVARVLQRSAGDKLSVVIETLTTLLDSGGSTTGPRRPRKGTG